jgi:hypothetical protein
MHVDERIIVNIEAIRAFTANDPVLREHAHHFLYDKRYSDASSIKFVVMGINPGEPPKDPNRRSDLPLEETSLYDFLKEGIETQAAKKWKDKCEFICGTLDIALTEALLWSSVDVNALQSRYGEFRTRYFEFAVKPNQQLIDIHDPLAVIFVGIGHVKEIARLYQLEPNGPMVSSQKKTREDRLVAPFKDNNGRPWIFFKHWSNRLSNDEKKRMRDYVAQYEFGRTGV